MSPSSPLVALVASLAFASGAGAQDTRFANPVPGTLTVKVTVDGEFLHPGKQKGEKFEGTVHRELSGSTYLDQASTGPTGYDDSEKANTVTAPGGAAAPPNEIEEMQKALEKCNKDMQCIQAIAMKMHGKESGSGEDDASPTFVTRYATWFTMGQAGENCFKGTAGVKESYTQAAVDQGEGSVGLVTGSWTVTGNTKIPTPGSIGELCGFKVVVDTKAKTYDISIDARVDIPVRSTRSGTGDSKSVHVFTGEALAVRGQRLPATGTTLTGTAQFPGAYAITEDVTKPPVPAHVVVTWTFKPGR